jgi:hypothetical protein
MDAWIGGSTDASQADIYNKIRDGLVGNDAADILLYGPNGVTGADVDACHDATHTKVVNLCTPSACSFATAYAYDLNGKVVGITYPGGDALTVTRTTDGLVSEIQYTPSGKPIQTVVSNVTYEPFGPLASAAYGNGLNLTRAYDQNYQLTRVEAAPSSGAAAVNVSYSWQADGRVAGVADMLVPTMGPTSRTSTFAYTPSGRVMTGDGPWGNNGYAYDATGNLTQNGGTTMTVASASNQITATAGATVRALADVDVTPVSHPAITRVLAGLL